MSVCPEWCIDFASGNSNVVPPLAETWPRFLLEAMSTSSAATPAVLLEKMRTYKSQLYAKLKGSWSTHTRDGSYNVRINPACSLGWFFLTHGFPVLLYTVQRCWTSWIQSWSDKMECNFFWGGGKERVLWFRENPDSRVSVHYTEASLGLPLGIKSWVNT